LKFRRKALVSKTAWYRRILTQKRRRKKIGPTCTIHTTVSGVRATPKEKLVAGRRRFSKKRPRNLWRACRTERTRRRGRRNKNWFSRGGGVRWEKEIQP